MEHKQTPPALQEALDAFWTVIARNYPEAKSGDLSPLTTVDFEGVAEKAVGEWIATNVPPHAEDVPVHCKTCGSEIVETINGSNFHEVECGPCEYQRYKSQPELLRALTKARAEIVSIKMFKDRRSNEYQRLARVLDLIDQSFAKAYGTTV